jgi:DNA replication protein DnaC
MNTGREEKQLNLLSFKCPALTYADFKHLIIVTCQNILLDRKISEPYVVDTQNGPALKQLYYYLTNSPECLWNLNAGLMFAGKPGCGKTLLMTAFCLVSNSLTKKQTTIIHAKNLAEWIRTETIVSPNTVPLFIDDVGREETEVKDYGNKTKPIIDLLGLRYEAGARTYATTNLKMDTLHKYYGGDYIGSRMAEMMTFIEFPGESRRLKNEIKTK